MKDIGGILVFGLLLLSSCSQSEPPQEKNKSMSADHKESYEMIVDACPEPTYDGQTFDELSAEEKELYDVGEMSDEMKERNPDLLQVMPLQSKRQEFFRDSISEKGYTLDDLRNIGDMYMVEGTIILQFKDQLTEEEQKVKESFMKTVKEIKQKFNENAIHTEKVEISANELREQHDALSGILDGSSIENKLWGYGTCTPSKQLKIEVTEQLTEEELKLLNENAEVEIAVQVNEPSQLEGYVTEVRGNEMLVDMIWFSNRPDAVKVGDHVNVSYTNVMESLPAQAGAMETEILKDSQPEGADMKTSAAIKKAVDQAKEKIQSPSHESEYLSVREIEYNKDHNQWGVLFETTVEEEMVEIQVKDE